MLVLACIGNKMLEKEKIYGYFCILLPKVVSNKSDLIYIYIYYRSIAFMPTIQEVWATFALGNYKEG